MWFTKNQSNTLSSNGDGAETFRPALLPELNWIKKPFVLTQNVSIHFKDQSLSLLTQAELTPQRITLVGLSHLGQRLFTISYDGHNIEQKHHLPEIPVDLNYIMRDFLWVYTPLAVLQKNVEAKGFVIREEQTAPQQVDKSSELSKQVVLRKRLIDFQHQQQIVISYRQRRPSQWDIQLNNPLRHYNIQITTVERQQL
ncbi:DUF3261 domain-containing protein [Zooshikella harenae]|uniref:DUF3261 domain-containing protein n=1 Tax=Zooshikella harenae TaxID=2827238 RepID=A0ABS5ZB27_9GAMM|nr:DUF3261 domain-containing protein [Zooshikella harenae]MBU2711264.1 DUF3261 domain-containing protein [Zooshikella harenae]